MNWKNMNSWTIVDASVRWRREGWLVSVLWLELRLGFTSRRKGSTTPDGNALRTPNCSSVVRSVGRARRR